MSADVGALAEEFEQAIDELEGALHECPDDLDHGRTRAKNVLASVTSEDLAKTCPPYHPHAGKTLAELLQVNLAHVREHAGQIRDFVAKRGAA